MFSLTALSVDTLEVHKLADSISFYASGLLGRLFDRVDLIKPVLNVRQCVRACVRPSICPQKV